MDISAITERLFVGTTPGTGDYDTLRSKGVTLVINMRVERGPAADAHNPAMTTLWLRTFDHPWIPIPIRAFERGVEAALKTMDQGGKVFTHCAAGVHRSVAMAACILIAQGHRPEDAMALIHQKRPVADPYSPYIQKRILKFAQRWVKKQGAFRFNQKG